MTRSNVRLLSPQVKPVLRFSLSEITADTLTNFSSEQLTRIYFHLSEAKYKIGQGGHPKGESDKEYTAIIQKVDKLTECISLVRSALNELNELRANITNL